MTIQSSQISHGKRTIAITGRFDFNCHPEFRAILSELGAGSEVIVDFKGTTYIDSAALGMLLLLRDRIGDPQRIQLTNCSGQPEQVLRIANFHKLFRYGNL